VSAWPLWQAPGRVRTYVLAVDVLAVAVAVVIGMRVAVTGTDLVRFAVLAVCAAVHIEATRAIERKREFLRGVVSPYVDTKSVWSFAAVLVLPPALASAMVLWTYLVAWWRIWPNGRPVPCYRWVFSAATVICGTHVAMAVLAVGLQHYPGAPSAEFPAAIVELTVVAAAGVLRWVLNAGLVFAAIMLSNPQANASGIFRNFGEHLLEAAALGLGLVAAVVVTVNPVVLVGIVLALIALHQVLLLPQHKHAARTDALTKLANSASWFVQAAELFARARERDGTLGVLMLDLDGFKPVNDNYGHPNGDKLLREVADAIRAVLRPEDVCGRLGGDEFAVLLPDVGSQHNLVRVADRLRHSIEMVTVPVELDGIPVDARVTVSIGGILYPAEGIETSEDLYVQADRRMYLAKHSDRDKTCFMG
jgi:diguanylate cyclase (GGDEF)-like protein